MQMGAAAAAGATDLTDGLSASNYVAVGHQYAAEPHVSVGHDVLAVVDAHLVGKTVSEIQATVLRLTARAPIEVSVFRTHHDAVCHGDHVVAIVDGVVASAQ
jgi:hypothetical protein